VHGALTVVAEDDFSRGTSRERYWIETGGDRVEVYFADHPNGLSSGHAVSVRGILARKEDGGILDQHLTGCGSQLDLRTNRGRENCGFDVGVSRCSISVFAGYAQRGSRHVFLKHQTILKWLPA
jgi:hypothetical protein